MPNLKLPHNYMPQGLGKKSPSYSPQQQGDQILENLAAAVYKCDKDGYVTFYNKAAAKLWGREPVLGQDLWCGSWKIYESDGVTPMPLDKCPMAIALKEGHAVRDMEIIVERPDNEKINVMPHPDPILNAAGKVIGAVNMLVDITALKKKENDLRESENKYKTLAAKLHSALQTEEEFMAIASHELKTPITSLNLYLEVLLSMHPELQNNDTNHLLTRSKLQVTRLIALLGDLLDVTKIKSGKLELHFEEVCLNNLLNDSIQDYTSTMSSLSIVKTGEITSTIKADKSRIEQVINNLLSNAIKYSGGADKILVVMSEDKKNVQVSIRDFGIGIAPKNVDKVFERFFRANASHEQRLSSLGLGLYIASDIISRHNGKIWVESEVGKGSTFYFSLPK